MNTTKRTSISHRRRLLVAFMASLAIAPVWGAAQAPFTAIVTFGDSLSDPGNVFALVGGTAVPPDYSVSPFLVPDRPYARGGHHFSNGPTWIEQLGRSIGLPASTHPAFRDASDVATNFAIGGARAFDEGVVDGDLPEQIAAYLQQTGGSADPDALYVIELGANDARDAVVAALSGGDPHVVVGQAVGSIGLGIDALYARGARNFLVWTVPNVGLTPAVAAAGTSAVSLAGAIAIDFNSSLDNALIARSALPGIHLVRFDVSQLLAQMEGAPAAFGLTNAITPCLTPNVPPFECASPETYLWWDGIHPTTAAHGVIARAVAQVMGL